MNVVNPGLEALHASAPTLQARWVDPAPTRPVLRPAFDDVASRGGLQRQMALQDSQIAAVESAAGSAEAYYRRGLLDSASARQARLPVLLEQGKALALLTGEIHAQVALVTALGGGYGPEAAAAVAGTAR